MRKIPSSFLILFLTLGLGACARRPAKVGVNFYVGKECKASATMIGCDAESKSSPPTGCKVIKLDYDKNCERLVISE